VKKSFAGLDKATLTGLIFESIHLLTLHYGIWFCEMEHQMGLDKAIAADDIVCERGLLLAFDEIGKRLKGKSLSAFFAGADREELEELLLKLANAWYVDDGVWFQAVENGFDSEMHNAKRINDSCWARFSYIEAKRMIKRLHLPENGGLASLKTALGYRLYSLINGHETIDVSENEIIFRVNTCKVQAARRRKGLAFYPCRSAGYVEYARFAKGIDARISTSCVGCPPDPHPGDWYCAWSFKI
jgi:hypothetical protein